MFYFLASGVKIAGLAIWQLAGLMGVKVLRTTGSIPQLPLYAIVACSGTAVSLLTLCATMMHTGTSVFLLILYATMLCTRTAVFSAHCVLPWPAQGQL